MRSMLPVNGKRCGYGPAGAPVSTPTSRVSPLIENRNGTVRSRRPVATSTPSTERCDLPALAQSAAVVVEADTQRHVPDRKRPSVPVMLVSSRP